MTRRLTVAFTVPTFNLLCDVYNGPWASRTLRIGSLPCNLALGRRVQQLEVDWTDVGFGPASNMLLVPALSDVRDVSQNIPFSDVVEVPRLSGRWYQINMVDDVGKGFTNEYRLCVLAKIGQNYGGSAPGLFWPIPMP